MTAIRAVVFDVGETLVDETAIWNDWADWLRVPWFTVTNRCSDRVSRPAPRSVLAWP